MVKISPLYLYRFRRKPAITDFDWPFTPKYMSSKSIATDTGSVLFKFLMTLIIIIKILKLLFSNLHIFRSNCFGFYSRCCITFNSFYCLVFKCLLRCFIIPYICTMKRLYMWAFTLSLLNGCFQAYQHVLLDLSFCFIVLTSKKVLWVTKITYSRSYCG